MRRSALAHSVAGLAVLALPVLCAIPHSGRLLAAEPPPLKEGLWSIHGERVDAPSGKRTAFTSTLCRSHASDRHTRKRARSLKECTTLSESRRAGKYKIESRCTIGGSAVDSRTTTDFLGNSIHTEVHSTYTPALNGVTRSTLVEDQNYLGKCPAGAEPGDVMLPNGTVQHLGPADTARNRRR